MINGKIIASGKRKTSVARAILIEGGEEIMINGRDYKTLHLFDKLKIEEPLKIYEEVLGKRNFGVNVTVKGGGEKSQIGAVKLALGKAIVEYLSKTDKNKAKDFREVLLQYDKSIVVADVRRKETCKPGDSKARSKRQSSKR